MVLTIEDVQYEIIESRTKKIHPWNLNGINGYDDDLTKNTVFCWRWLTSNGAKFRVVTLEERENNSIEYLKKKVLPHEL
jgi:hypothetical protein